MNHYMDFDPYAIRERNEQMIRDVNSLRLEERLREARGSSGVRFINQQLYQAQFPNGNMDPANPNVLLVG